MDDKKILKSLIFFPVRSWFEIVISDLAFREFYYILLVTEDAVEYNLALGVYDG
jgi:hypothetical protein